MSEFREDLLVSTINKKRLVKIILTAALLVASFAFSVFLFSLLWGTQRPLPSDRLLDAEYEDVVLIIPPFPYNMSDFQDQFSDLNLTQDQLQDLLDALQDMFDGDIDDLDLSDFSQAMAALMFSEVEAFRVRNYDQSIFEMEQKLWRYESFDEYNGSTWHSTAASAPADFYESSDYWAFHSDKDLIEIEMPLSANAGTNSFVIPSFFPDPYIIDESFSSSHGFIDYFNNPPNLYKDDYNCTTLHIDFNTEGDLNMTYNMFGLDLPTSAEIAAVAIEPLHTPDTLESKYLKLRGDTVDNYINDWDDFATHVNILNGTMSKYLNGTISESAYEVADKIRTYLYYNFNKITDPDQYTPAPDGYDYIEWFLEQGTGYWPDFTSAFCAFGRAFGLATRFVDGFNSFGIQEFLDNGRDTFAIKYRNLYNWAEVFIPTAPGDGFWIQMDVYYDIAPTSANYSLTLNSDFNSGYRGGIANITATLTLDGSPAVGEPINFYDSNSGQYLGESYTDINGNASISIPLDDTQVVGPHTIYGQFSNITNTTYFEIYGDIEVNLLNVNPQSINITIDDIANIVGFVEDPINNQRVRWVPLDFNLFYKGTSVEAHPNPFDWGHPGNYAYTDDNGDFDYFVTLDNGVSIGQYELRVDLNMSSNKLNASSNKLDLNVTKGIEKAVWFYINDVDRVIHDAPIVNRIATITLKAKVVNETNHALPNEIVSFYDYDRGILIGTNTTNNNGETTFDYALGNFNTIGPNLLYAKLGGKENYSYFILNEEPWINIISGPTPREINRTAAGASNTLFNIEGEILDPINNNPIRTSQLTLKLIRGGTDYSSYLIPNGDIYIDFNGYFNINFEVASNTPVGNYSLRLDFNGTIDWGWHPEYSTSFDLPYINTSSSFLNKLKISTPTTLLFNFWIDGTTSYDYNNPVIYPDSNLNLSVYLESDGIPIGDGESIDFFDVTQNVNIGSAQTLNGFASLIYDTGPSAVAGPHQIYACWGANFNHSYFIIDNPISLTLNSGPNPREIMRTGVTQRTFNLQGDLTDFTLGTPIKYGFIYVYLFDGPIDVSHYLVLESGSQRLDQTGVFDLTYSVLSSTPETNYTLQIEFSGTFMYSWPYNLNNEHDFYLGGFSNFTDIDIASNELKVIDPENLDILLSVEGNPTLPFYNNTNPPETYNFGDTVHIQVQINHALPFTGNTVYLYDDFTSTLISSHIFTNETGFYQFNIQTNDLHAGLIRFRINYHTYSTFNTTYIVINETIDISINIDRYVIQRDFHQFDVWGVLQQNGTNLDGLNIGLYLLDSSYTDVTSSYLNINGPQFYTVNGGNYQYYDNSIFLSCPQGQYYILIYFTGSINEAGISLNNYMIPTFSSFEAINITAGTTITGNYDTEIVKDDFYEGDNLFVYGYLYWDNGTPMTFMQVEVTVRNNLGQTLATATGSTDINGFFNITLPIGSWPSDAEVWVSFYPEDNFSYPEYYYVEFYEIEVFRET